LRTAVKALLLAGAVLMPIIPYVVLKQAKRGFIMIALSVGIGLGCVFASEFVGSISNEDDGGVLSFMVYMVPAVLWRIYLVNDIWNIMRRRELLDSSGGLK
jgi:hypothetical protein